MLKILGGNHIATKGTNLTKSIELGVSKETNGEVIVFRVNAGTFWGGKVAGHSTVGGKSYVTLQNATRVEGFPAGFPDLLLLYSEKITPDMVGKTVLRAGFIEVKAEGDKVKDNQEYFIQQMRLKGADRAGFARTTEDGVNIAKGTCNPHS
jgi:hypothetical protein